MIAKRVFDLLAVVPGLIVLSPLLLVLAILVKVSSRGPVFFRQTRVGQFGHPFEILKFRTMRDDAAASGPQVTVNNDPRITGVGRVLRQYKLDELPQLFNVLFGDMSLVGPRPEVPKYVEYYDEQQAATVLSVRPGITDNAAIQFRHESDILAEAEDPEHCYINEVLPAKIRLYIQYVENRSFAGDLAILGRTFAAIVRKQQ